MGHFVPVFLTFLLNSLGIYVYTKSQTMDCLPYFSYFIFLLAVFYFLWGVNLKLVSHRRLHFLADFIVEFTVAMFLMECIMNHFWLPLEIAFVTLLPIIADFLLCCLNFFGIRSPGIRSIINMLKWQETLLLATYVLSIFFLLCALHATRTLDFKLLRDCPAEFFIDAYERNLQFGKKLIRALRKGRILTFVPKGENECRLFDPHDAACCSTDPRFLHTPLPDYDYCSCDSDSSS